jgi:DNA polymerase-3 subunit epsilon
MELDELKKMADILNAHPDFKVQERLIESDVFMSPTEGVQLHKGVYLDVETTGTTKQDKIIELAILQFTFDAKGVIYEIVDKYTGFEDPKELLSDAVKEVTGITDEDIKGHTLDDERVNEIMNDSLIVVAHNAQFDRGFIDRRFPDLNPIRWACSINDIDWSTEKVPGKALSVLCGHSGFFFDAHRAETDVRAALKLLTQVDSSGAPFFNQIRKMAGEKTFRIWTHGAPFAVKDDFKANGYKWHEGSPSMPKAWHKTVNDEAGLLVELEWLDNSINSLSRSQFSVEEINSFIRYSENAYGERRHAADMHDELNGLSLMGGKPS